MYDNTELHILEQIFLHPGIHSRELARKLGLGMPSIEYALKKLDFLLRKERSGNQIHYFLNYAEPGLTPALVCVEYVRFQQLPQKVRLAVRDFLHDLPEKPLIAILFGSYAKKTETKTSDIDILLVFQKLENTKIIENTAKRISMRTNTLLSPVYLDYQTFKESFHNNTKDFFKNIKKDKIVLAGFEWWRLLIHEET